MSPAGSGRARFRGSPDDLMFFEDGPPDRPRNLPAPAIVNALDAAETRRRRAELVGTRIALARRANGLSRAQLAELLEDTPAHIARWELGRHEPSACNLQRLSEVLEVPLWFFFGGPPAGA